MSWLRENQCHILFLDIAMPQHTGLELVRMMGSGPAVIFTTAYSEFALDAYELDAADYLLKPFSFERFARAITKAEELLEIKALKATGLPDANLYHKESDQSGLTIRSNGRLVKLALQEIIYIQSYNEYVSIHTASDRFLIYERLKNIEKLLPAKKFYRVHRSYIVSLEKIRAFSGNLVDAGGVEIPVSRNNRSKLFKKMRNE
jgi:DNA-binding LytR/AlgR family response regulator